MMKKLTFVLLALLAFSLPLAADELPEIPAPEITVEDWGDYVSIEASVVGEGYTVYLLINGDVVENPFLIEKSWDEQTVCIEAYAMDENGFTSEHATCEYTIPPMAYYMPIPVITIVEEESYVVISAEGEGDLHLVINGVEVENPCYYPRTNEWQDIYITAVASGENCYDSDPAEVYYQVPPLIEMEMTESPIMMYEITGETEAVVTIEPTEEGSELYYRFQLGYPSGDYTDWTEWLDYEGPIVFNQEGHYIVEAFAQAPGKYMSYLVALEFELVNSTPPAPDWDFEVDGIYYKIIGEGKVRVVEHYGEPFVYEGDIVIPNQVTHNGVTYHVVEIRAYAFNNCTGLTSVSIGDYVTTIGEYAFYGCTGLTELTLGDYVINVGEGAFSHCTGLTKVTFGHGLRSIGDAAFDVCSSLATVVCKPAVPPVMSSSNCFDCYSTATLKVFPAVLDSYQGNHSWSRFVNIVGQDAIAPVAGDVDGDGKLGISDVSTLIDILLAM